MSQIANTPEPPYYAVVFTSLQNQDTEGYDDAAARMRLLAERQPGYLGFESARTGLGIAVSYWQDLESIVNWKRNAEHLIVQAKGRDRWYNKYTVRVCRVERAYSFDSGD